jgi:hypothetical protein
MTIAFYEHPLSSYLQRRRRHPFYGTTTTFPVAWSFSM